MQGEVCFSDKMRSPTINRRTFASKLLDAIAALVWSGIMLIGCSRTKTEADAGLQPSASADPCSDLSGVSDNDLDLRKKFAYVKESPVADNQCNNCNLYLPPKPEASCGGCMLFKGPVYSSGYCTYWAPKV